MSTTWSSAPTARSWSPPPATPASWATCACGACPTARSSAPSRATRTRSTRSPSPPSNTIATGSYDQTIKLWNRQGGKELRTLAGHNGCVYDLAFRADGRVLASASADRTVKLWDVATGERLDTFSEPLKEQYAVTWSPDGARVAAAGVDNRIRVWSVSAAAKEGTNRLLVSRFAHEGAILRLAWSGDGKTLLSSADDRTVKLWDATGEVTAKLALPPQPDWPTAVALAEGAVIVGRPDGSLDFFDAATGAAKPPPAPPKPEIASVEPRGVRRGEPNRLRLRGKNLAELTEAKSGNAALSAKLAADPSASNESAWVEITPAKDFPFGAHSIALAAPGGSVSFNVHVEDLPQVAETEPNDSASAATPGTTVPLSFWGGFERRGDADHFAFDARAGQKLVLDLAARRISAKTDAVLTVFDASGKALAAARDTDGEGDPLVVFTPSADGRYVARVTDLQVAASPEHFYRLSVGEFAVVTGAFPLGVQPNTETTVRLTGHNLPADASATVKAGGEGEAQVSVDEQRYRVRRAPEGRRERPAPGRRGGAQRLARQRDGDERPRRRRRRHRRRACGARCGPVPVRREGRPDVGDRDARRPARLAGRHEGRGPPRRRPLDFARGRPAGRAAVAARRARHLQHLPPHRRQPGRGAAPELGGDGAEPVPLHAGRGRQAVPPPARARLAVGLLLRRRQAALLLRHQRHRPRPGRAVLHRRAARPRRAG